MIPNSSMRAFHHGRMRYALYPLLPILTFTALAMGMGQNRVQAFVLSCTLLMIASRAFFVGGTRRNAAIVGMRAGAIAFFAPVVAGHRHCEIGGECVAYCLVACIAAGLLAGFYCAWFTRADTELSAENTFTSAVLCVGLTTLGCTMAGFASFYGSALGFVAGVAGVQLWRRVYA